MQWQISESLLRILAQMGKNAGETRFSHLMLGSGLAGLLMACAAHAAVCLESASRNGPEPALAAAAAVTLGTFIIWLLRLPFFPFNAITGASAFWCGRLRPANLAYSWLVILLGNLAGALLGVVIISWSGYEWQQYYPGAAPALSPSGLAYALTAGGSLNLGFAAHFFRGLLFEIMVGWGLVFYINPPRLVNRAGLFMGAVFLAAGGGLEQVVDIMFRVPLGLHIAAANADLISTALVNGSRPFPMNSSEAAGYFNSIRFLYGVFIPVLLGNISGGALMALLLAHLSGYRRTGRQSE